jgi:hypothetical protein
MGEGPRTLLGGNNPFVDSLASQSWPSTIVEHFTQSCSGWLSWHLFSAGTWGQWSISVAKYVVQVQRKSMISLLAINVCVTGRTRRSKSGWKHESEMSLNTFLFLYMRGKIPLFFFKKKKKTKTTPRGAIYIYFQMWNDNRTVSLKLPWSNILKWSGNTGFWIIWSKQTTLGFSKKDW